MENAGAFPFFARRTSAPHLNLVPAFSNQQIERWAFDSTGSWLSEGSQLLAKQLSGRRLIRNWSLLRASLAAEVAELQLEHGRELHSSVRDLKKLGRNVPHAESY